VKCCLDTLYRDYQDKHTSIEYMKSMKFKLFVQSIENITEGLTALLNYEVECPDELFARIKDAFMIAKNEPVFLYDVW
jgi:hypothetical protein